MLEVIFNKHVTLQKDLRELEISVKPEDFILLDIKAIRQAENMLVEKYAYKTVKKEVADYFKRYGFAIITDFDKSYVIVA